MCEKSKDMQIQEMTLRIEELEKQIKSYKMVVSMLDSNARHFGNMRNWILERKIEEQYVS